MILSDSLSLYPRPDQCAHFPLKHMPILHLDCCEVVKTLCIQVSIFMHFFEGLVKKCWPLPISAEKPASYDTSAMVLLSSLSRSRFPEAVSLRAPLWKVPILHDDELLCFDDLPTGSAPSMLPHLACVLPPHASSVFRRPPSPSACTQPPSTCSREDQQHAHHDTHQAAAPAPEATHTSSPCLIQVYGEFVLPRCPRHARQSKFSRTSSPVLRWSEIHEGPWENVEPDGQG